MWPVKSTYYQVLSPAPSPLYFDNQMTFQVFDSYFCGAIDSAKFRHHLQTLLTYLKTKQNMDIWLLGSAADLYIQPTSPYIGDLDFFCQRKDCVGKFKDGDNNDSRGRELVYERDYSAQRQIDFISDQDRFFKYCDIKNRCNPERNI